MACHHKVIISVDNLLLDWHQLLTSINVCDVNNFNFEMSSGVNPIKIRLLESRNRQNSPLGFLVFPFLRVFLQEIINLVDVKAFK